MPQKHHISVCICTYKRPELLRRLLSKLEEQDTEGLFDYSIVIVDNDRSESARQTAESCARQSKISIRYYVEPEQNIALARNKVIEHAKGDLIGLIDDDEFPIKRWLLNLYKALKYYKSDGILGPVLPYFKKEPPGWVLRGHFFDRPLHPTGYVLGWKNTRTGNALLIKELFREDCQWFDPAFGSGGEDIDFFMRKIAEGHVFVWCNQAPVFETVSPNRWKRSFLIKRAMLRGRISLQYPEGRRLNVLKLLVAVSAYGIALSFLQLLGHHLFMKYLVKLCDHAGRLLALLGLNSVREREM